MKKNVAVVGYGGMGQWHVCSIAGTTYLNAINFRESDVCSVYGIYDIDPEKRALAKKDGYKVFETLEDLLSDSEIDIVVIATPNDVHESIAIAALNAGKHVISEKPVTMSCEALENMIAAAEKNGKIFSVHQNRRYDDYYIGMKKIALDGEIGDIISIESRVHGDHGVPGDWRKTVEKGGGMLYDWGVHMIDQQLWMLGYDVESVYARFDYLTGIPVDDGCFIDIKLKSGKNLHVEICTYNFIQLPLMYMRGTTGTLPAVQHGARMMIFSPQKLHPAFPKPWLPEQTELWRVSSIPVPQLTFTIIIAISAMLSMASASSS